MLKKTIILLLLIISLCNITACTHGNINDNEIQITDDVYKC